MAGGKPCEIDVKLAKVEGRKNATIKDRSGGSYKCPVFCVSFDSGKHSLISGYVSGR